MLGVLVLCRAQEMLVLLTGCPKATGLAGELYAAGEAVLERANADLQQVAGMIM